MSDLTTDSVPRKPLDVRIRKSKSKFLIARGNEVRDLSPTAESIWREIDGKATVRDISRIIAGEFDVELDVVLVDTLELLDGLSDAGLVDY